MRRKFMLMGAILAAAVATTALLSASAGASTKLTKVTLQLKWVTQAQFAGYYAAAAQGYYKQAGLDVNLKVGGPNITPETVVIGGGADIGLDWLPNLFATDEKGGGLVSVAQMYARSGMTEITWKSSGINSIAKMKRQEGRRLVLRQPAGALRRSDEERHRSDEPEGRDDLQPAVRHERVPLQADRRRGGDDLQRAGAGAGDEGPGDGEALSPSPT